MNDTEQTEAERKDKVRQLKAAMIDIDTKRELIRIKIEHELLELSRIKHHYNKMLFDLDLLNGL